MMIHIVGFAIFLTLFQTVANSQVEILPFGQSIMSQINANDGNQQNMGTKIYDIQIDQGKIAQNDKNGNFYVIIEPEISAETIYDIPYKVDLQKVNQADGSIQHIKICKIQEEIGDCFIEKQHFEVQDIIRVTVHCSGHCKFHTFSQVRSAHILGANQYRNIHLDNTGSTRLFSIRIDQPTFDQLLIILHAVNKVSIQPMVLLANWGNSIPSHQQHDFEGGAAWGDRLIISISQKQFVQKEITVLVSGPQSDLLRISNHLHSYEKAKQLHSEATDFDAIVQGITKQYFFKVNGYNSYHIRVTEYSGKLSGISKLLIVDNTNQQTPLEIEQGIFTSHGQVQYFISQQMITQKSINKVYFTISGQEHTNYAIDIIQSKSELKYTPAFYMQSSYLRQGQVDQYFMPVFKYDGEKSVSSIEIVLKKMSGGVNIGFYHCYQGNDIDQEYPYKDPKFKVCEIQKNAVITNSISTEKYQLLTPAQFEINDQQAKYWLEFSWQGINANVSNIVMILQKESEAIQCLYSVYFWDTTFTYMLREGEIVTHRLFDGQYKRYKFQISKSDDAKKLLVHIVKTFGDVDVKGYLSDPRQSEKEEKYPVRNILTFDLVSLQGKQKQYHSIFIEISASESSLYSLTTQVIRQSEENTDDPNQKGYNQMQIKQQIPYQRVLLPHQNLVLQTNINEKFFVISAHSSSPLTFCLTEKLSEPPFMPNCEVKFAQSTQTTHSLRMERGKALNIGVTNMNEVNVTFYIYLSPINKQCARFGMNSLMSRKIRVDQNVSITCFEYELNKIEDLEVTVLLQNRQLYQNNSFQVKINSFEDIIMTTPNRYFQEEEIRAACKTKDSNSSLCFMRVHIPPEINGFIKIYVQYISDSIQLIEGISHEIHGMMKKREPKHFLYEFFNEMEVDIVLQSKVGKYVMYGTIYSLDEYSEKSLNDKQLYPTSSNSEVESHNPFFDLHQTIKIPSDQIKKECQEKSKSYGVDCIILLSVYLDEEDEYRQNSKFSLMATQRHRQLEANQIAHGYLTTYSQAFYTYHNNVQNGTIMIYVNTHSKRCLDLMIREGAQIATYSDFDQKQRFVEIMVFQEAKAGQIYSITVEATQNCPYSIQVSSSSDGIKMVKKGSFTDISLLAGNHQILLFDNLINQTFKILPLYKSGQVVVSAKPVSYEEAETELQKGYDKIKWTWKSKDFLRIYNIDFLKKQPDPQYCVDCFYLIGLEAEKDTEASIVIPTPQTHISVSEGTMIKDYLMLDEYSNYRIFTGSKGQFQLYVHHGRLNLSIIDEKNKSTIFSKIYTQTQQTLQQNFESPTKLSYDYLRYNTVIIHALDQTSFSFKLMPRKQYQQKSEQKVTPEPEQVDKHTKLEAGIPYTYVISQKQRQKCFSGRIESKMDRFYIGFTTNMKKYIANVSLSLEVRKKSIKLRIQRGESQLVAVIVQQSQYMEGPYILCLKYNNERYLSKLTVIQSSSVVYWPQGMSILVLDQLNMTFGSEGTSLVEVNDCESRAIISVHSSFMTMGTAQSKVKQNRISQQNVLNFTYDGAVYLNVKSKKSSVRWMRYDPVEGKGIGYDIFTADKVWVVRSGGGINVKIKQLNRIIQSQYPKILQLQYVFALGINENELYSALNCGSELVKTVKMPKQRYISGQQISQFYNIETEIKPFMKGSDSFVVGVKALMKIQTNFVEIESYRLMYSYDIVDKDFLNNPQLQEEDSGEQQQNWGDVIFQLAILIAIACLCRIFYQRRCRNIERNNIIMEESGIQSQNSVEMGSAKSTAEKKNIYGERRLLDKE